VASPRSRPLLTYVGTCIAWGSVFALVAEAEASFNPTDIVLGRSLLGAVVLVLMALYRGESMPSGWTTWGHLWVVSLLASVIPGLFVAIAEVHVSSALAGILAGMIPLSTLLFLVAIFREEPVHHHQVVGLVIGFVGLVVITGVWRGLGHNTWWAVLLLLITVFSYGLVFPYIKHHLSPLALHPLTLASGQQIMATLTVLPLALFSGLPHHASLTGWTMVVLLGVFPGGLAFMWNFETVAAWGSATASTVEYVCAVVAVAEGLLWLRESIQWNQPVGGAIVIIGALIGWGQLPPFSRGSTPRDLKV